MNAKQFVEMKQLIRAIKPFFTKEMWDKFCGAAPFDSDQRRAYLLAEWHRIAAEFEIEVA